MIICYLILNQQRFVCFLCQQLIRICISLVYSTRAHMLQALPFLSHGAISLDGGLVRSNGVIVFGTRDEMKVRCATSSFVGDDIENKMKELKWRKETLVEEVQREEAMLQHVKYIFEVKMQEFVRFMAQSSRYVIMQYPVQATPQKPQLAFMSILS
ncbi:hypothetical protein Hanom_Chr06g00571971 [Helianthus anomalus]